MAAVRRIAVDKCCGVLIDYQDFFIAQTNERLRSRIRTNTKNLVRLLGYFQIPMIVTLERPVDGKGAVPEEIGARLGERAHVFEKDFFDFTKEKKIRDHLGRLKKKQIIVAGCETDVCVLQSCLGLLGLGYEVYLVEDALFSSSRDTDAAIARMRGEGAALLTYKTLYYELVEAVDGGPHADRMVAKFGPPPADPA